MTTLATEKQDIEPELNVERVTELSDDDLAALCEAADAAII